MEGNLDPHRLRHIVISPLIVQERAHWARMEALSDDDEISTGRPVLQIRFNLSSGAADKPQAKPLAPSNQNGNSVMPGEAMQQILSALCLLNLRQSSSSPMLLNT